MCSSDQANTNRPRRQISLGGLITSYWSGYSFRSSDYTDAGIPVLTKGDIKPRGGVQHGGRFVDEAMLASKRVRTTNANDFLVSTRDLTTAADFLGLVSKAPQARAFAVNQGVTVFQVDENQVDRGFLAYWCEGPEFRGYVKGHFSGATQIHIRHLDLMAAPVSLPDIAEQRRIASILSAYDELIENNTRRIAILEEMARRTYEEWFVRFRFPGHENVRMVESEIGMIPQWWQEASLGDVLDSIRAATHAGEHLSDRKYVPIDCIARRTLSLAEFKHWTEAQSSLVLFEKGDILFGAMRAYFHKVCIAPFAGVTRTTCFVLRPRRPELRAFGTLTAFADATVDYAAKHSQGATIPYAVWEGSLSRMKVVMPPADLLLRFETTVSPMLDWIKDALLRQANLRTTRDLLLPKLISGELDVSKVPEPESA